MKELHSGLECLLARPSTRQTKQSFGNVVMEKYNIILQRVRAYRAIYMHKKMKQIAGKSLIKIPLVHWIQIS